MSEWKLSVRLEGQGTGLRRTLRDTSRDARTASRDVNALRRDITLLRNAARDDIDVRVRLHSGNLRTELRTALNTAGSGEGLSVSLRLANSMDLRREVNDAVRWATMGQRISIPIGLADSMQLRRDVSAAVRWASMNQTINIRVNPDTSALNGLNTNAGGGTAAASAGLSAGLQGLLLLAPAAIPLLAGIAANAAPIAGQFLAAGGAATAFGIAIAGQVGAMSEVAEAEKAYQDAVREHGRASAEAMSAQLAYQQRLAALPPETQKAAVALSQLKGTFSDWSDDMSSFTMQPVAKGFTVLQELIPHLTPEVQSFSGQLDRLMDVAGGAVTTPGFDAFSDRVGKLTDAKLDDFTDDVIHLMRVLSEGAPGDGALAQILTYMRQNGPEAREAVDAIGDAVVTLAQGAAQAGPSMLTLVTAAARLAAALPPELVAIILQVATALKILQLAGVGMAAVSGAVATLQTRIAALAATSAAAGGGLAGLSAGIAAMSTKAKIGLAVGAVGALVLALHELSDNKPAVEVDALSTSLNTLLATGQKTGVLKDNIGELSSSIAMVSKEASDNKLAQWTSDFGTWVGIAEGPGISTARKNVDAWDQSMANLVRSGNPKQAAAQYELLKKAWVAGGGDLERLKEFTTSYDQALADAKFEQDMTAQSMGLFGKAAQDVSAQLSAQMGAADSLRASLLKLNETNRSAYDSEIAFESAMDDLTDAFKENGANLDINTRAGQANGQAMSSAAKAQDDMIASGLAAGESLATMTQRSSALREQMMRLATDAFDGNTKKAREYVNVLLGTPKDVTTYIKAERENAITGLEAVRSAIAATPDAHTVTVDTLNASAIAALEAVGLKTRQLPDGSTEVYTANGQSLGSISSVSTALNNLDGKTANTYINTTHTDTYRTFRQGERDYMNKADGGVLEFYANGGMRGEQHLAQIARPGTLRVWAEPETGGESYIPLARSKRVRSRAIAEETVLRLGGDPMSIQWNANGSVTDWRYDPQTGSLYSPSDAGAAGHKTKKVKGKEVDYFSLGAVENKLRSASKATKAWNADLEKVADRVGGDVAEALAAMGEDGMKLADKMANGSTKYINEMAAALRNLQKVAKASLTDYTRQLGNATKLNKAFSDDLAQLAAMGYGDLAAQLAAQNDEAAQQLADAAVKDPKKAKKADAEVKKANNALTSEEVQSLVQIIAAIKNSKTGIHAVAGTTGLGEDEIITVGNKANAQIRASLGGRALKFLEDLKAANAGKAYADGGIRAGIYGTRAGIIKFGEPETGGEAYLPLGANKRRTAMPVLADVARRFGVGLSDAQSSRTVIIRESAPLIGHQVNNVTSGGSARETAREIEQRFAWQLRRAKRGGVGVRAAQ